MRIRAVLTSLSFGILLANTPAYALDLAEAYNKALSNDPAWSATLNTFRADKENIDLARGYLLPSIDLNGSITKSSRDAANGDDVDYTTTQWTARATQPLFRVDAWYAYKQAKSIDSQIDASFRQYEQDLALRVATAYFNVLRAQETLAYSEAEEKAFARQMDQAQKRFDVGLIAITDVLAARAQYDGARAGRYAAEAALSSAREELAVVTGEYETKVDPLRSDVTMSKPVPENPEEWATLARERNPQLLVAKYNAEASASSVNVNRAGYLPQVNLFAQYQDLDSGSSPSAPFSDGTTTSYGVEANWNVFGGGRTMSQVRQASYRADAARDQVNATERQVVSGARSAYLNVSANAYQVDARRQAVVSAESSLAATQAGYEVGTRNIVDVLLAQSTAFAAKRDYANARYDYIINSLQLKATTGQLTAEDIKELNGWLDPNGAVTAFPAESNPAPLGK